MKPRIRNNAIWIGAVAQISMAMLACLFVFPARVAAQRQADERVIDVIAGHDSRFKIPGQEKPVITVKAGEPVHLRITAVKAKNRNRDGSVHGLALLRPGDHKVVPGWDLLLKPGVQEFDLKAPEQPGEYLAVCTVICSSGHEHMTLKFIVEPAAK
jgi:heme/copper-type cytochrome/quinol oxidase subunit 2